MRSLATIGVVVLVAILFEVSFFSDMPDFDYSLQPSDDSLDASQINQARLPFIENQGQVDDGIKYYAKTFAGTVYVTDSDLTYHSIKKDSEKALIIKERFLGDSLQPVGVERSQAVVSYFKGSQESWNAGIPTFDGVLLGTIWPNIDVKLKAYGNNVEKIFTVHPSGNPADIKLTFEGTNGLSLSENNELVVDTELGAIVLSKPIAYQIIDGNRNDVSASYHIIDSKTYGFSVLSYDPRFEIVIDPLIASTFIGSSGNDIGRRIALDDSGNVYITGQTSDDTADLPTTAGAYNTTHNGGTDVFVSKFNSVLTTLSASTFIGGSSTDFGAGIALDDSGNVYITGWTVDHTKDFPTTAGAFNNTHSGAEDVFVSKFNSTLTSLSASTLIGGSHNDEGHGIILDESGNVYITGWTTDHTTDFPTTAGAYNTTHNGGTRDVFVSKFNSGLTTLSASTFIGGSGNDNGNGIALDDSGNVYITGQTQDVGTDFPTTAGAFNTTHAGSDDVFVSKFNSGLTTLSASTFIGASGSDIAYGIAVDGSDNVYITGETDDVAIDFPTTAGAFNTTHAGSDDVFVSKFNSGLTTLSASTLIGGSGSDIAYGIAVDSFGHTFITGQTANAANDFPTTTGALNTTHNGGVSDAFVSKFNFDLTSLSASTFIGGSANGIGGGDDIGYGITVDSSGNVYITGQTSNVITDFPTTVGAYDTTINGGDEVFVSILDCDLLASGNSCGTIESGGSTSVPVSAGGTAQVDLPSGNTLSVTLPAGVSGVITFTDTDSGSSDQSIEFFGDIIDIDPTGGASCATGCTVSFIFTGTDAADEGLSPSDAVVYHDSNENGSFESGEGLVTTVTGSDPYTATATASFTSKFAVGGVRANVAAAAQSLSAGGFFKNLSSCESNGFDSGVSLRVYSISYDKCENNQLQVLAYSTCGPIVAEVTTKIGRYTLGISSTQPFLNDKEKKIALGANISPELESFNILIKDKRDSFTDRIMLNQCNATKTYTHTTGYTSEQQGLLVRNDTKSQITPASIEQTKPDIPPWIKNNAKWWSSGQIADSEFTQGIEYLIKQDIINVPESTQTDTAQESKQIPNWIKTNSRWWADGMISDSEFIQGLEYLIKVGIIRV